MRTRIQKWGNSLAIRIPRPFAAEARIDEDSPVDVSVRSGKLIIVPIEEITLDSLVDRITDDNRHAEVATGQPVGNETW